MPCYPYCTEFKSIADPSHIHSLSPICFGVCGDSVPASRRVLPVKSF
jgi:hypothetical protein